MKRTEPGSWRRTSPLAAVFFLGNIIKAIVKNALQALAPIAAYSVASEGPVSRNAIAAGTVLMTGVVIVAILRYLFFRFRIEDDSILIRDGIIRKTQLDIKFERIQAINTDQNILYRPFGLVNVRLDTAGSSRQEGHLPAVTRSLAEDLEKRLERRRSSESAIPADEQSEPDQGRHDAGEAVTLRAYTFRDLLTIGLTSNRAVILVAIAAPFLETLFDGYIDSVGPTEISEATRAARQGDPMLFAAAFAGFAISIMLLLTIASVGGSILSYFRFRLIADAIRFRSTGGLLTRHEHAVRYSKIQALDLHQNLLQRFAGVFRISARQAASGSESARTSFSVPLVEPSLLGPVSEATFGDEFADCGLDPRRADFSPVARHYIRSNVLARGVLPALAAALLLSPSLRSGALAALFWIPAAWLYFHQSYKHLGVRIRENGLAMRSGFIGRRVVVFLFRKVQRITVSQSPFQRRRDLATLKLFLASGVVRIPYVHLNDARRLSDYILFRVEADKRAWH